MKCVICKKKVEVNELGKIKGIYVKIDGKLYVICSNCQRKYKDKVKEKAMEILKKK